MILELEAEDKCCTEGIFPAFKTVTFPMCLHMAERTANFLVCLLAKTQVPSHKPQLLPVPPSLHCQLWNHLGDTPWAMSMKVFPDRFN